MNCQEVMELMHRQLDGDLSEDELIVLMSHTSRCPECAATFERLKRLSAELASLPKVTPKYSLVDAIMPELERIEQQSKQAAALQNSAALSTSEQPAASRRLQRTRRWPSWSAIGSVVAAGIVAGFFIINAPSEFDGDSANQAAEYNADITSRSIAESSGAAAKEAPAEGEGAAGGDIPVDELKVHSFHNASNEDTMDAGVAGNRDAPVINKDVEVEVAEPAASEAPVAAPAPTPEPDVQVEEVPEASVSGEPAVDPEADPEADPDAELEAVPEFGGEVEDQNKSGHTTEPPNGIAAFDEFPSPDGRYIAKAEEFSIIVVSGESGETVMETPRKNGRHGQLEWSENGTELFYEVQLDQGAIEKYVIQTTDWTETKAPH